MNFEHVAAGACISDTNYWCAFEKAHCPAGTTFVSARMLDLQFKDSPALNCISQGKNVPMGRCTQPSDNGLCTGNKSNCQGCFETDGICFELNNQACTLEATNNIDGIMNITTFGSCVNPTNPEEESCLWSRDECPSTDMWVTPSRKLGYSEETNDICTCDKVLVGACRFGEELLCAVSADSCDDVSQYIGVKELRDIQPSLDCRLCEIPDHPENPITSPQQQENMPDSSSLPATPEQITSYLVPAGACMGDNHYLCALERSHCPEGTDFVSARMLDLDFKDSPAVNCINRGVNVPMGQCTQPVDNGLCTGEKSNCEGCYETDDVCFELNSQDCALERMKEDDGSINNFAAFGLCANPVNPVEESCLWSRDECPSTHTWMTPTNDNFCACDQVDVGACRFGKEFICAVSADSCDDVSQYIGAKQLRNIQPSLDCRLCEISDPSDNSADVISPTSILPATQLAPTGQPSTLGSVHATHPLATASPITQEDSASTIPTPENPPSPIGLTPQSAPDQSIGCPDVRPNGCSICGEGMCISNPDSMFQYPGDPEISCIELEEAGYLGEIPLEFCPLFPQTKMPEVCGCSSTRNTIISASAPPENIRTIHLPAIIVCIIAFIAIIIVMILKVEKPRYIPRFFSHKVSYRNHDCNDVEGREDSLYL